MTLRKGFLFLALVGLTGSALFADTLDGKTIELAHYAKAYIGQGNITVEVAPYKSDDGPGAILLFHGIESAWDGKALNHRVRPGPLDGQDYVTTYHGKDWATLIVRKSDGKTPAYALYLPDVTGEIALTPSDGAAQLTDPHKIFQEYQQQEKNGAIP